DRRPFLADDHQGAGTRSGPHPSPADNVESRARARQRLGRGGIARPGRPRRRFPVFRPQPPPPEVAAARPGPAGALLLAPQCGANLARQLPLVQNRLAGSMRLCPGSPFSESDYVVAWAANACEAGTRSLTGRVSWIGSTRGLTWPLRRRMT